MKTILFKRKCSYIPLPLAMILELLFRISIPWLIFLVAGLYQEGLDRTDIIILLFFSILLPNFKRDFCGCCIDTILLVPESRQIEICRFKWFIKKIELYDIDKLTMSLGVNFAPLVIWPKYYLIIDDEGASRKFYSTYKFTIDPALGWTETKFEDIHRYFWEIKKSTPLQKSTETLTTHY